VEVKLYQHEGELYVLAKSEGRQAKEIAMRRKRLVRLLRKLRAMRKSLPKRDQLLLRIGAARKEAGRAFGFVKIQLPTKDQEVTRETFSFGSSGESVGEFRGSARRLSEESVELAAGGVKGTLVVFPAVVD
jgi:hypothetical protein